MYKKMRKKLFIGKLKVILVFSMCFIIIFLPVTLAVEISQTFSYDGNGNLVTGDGYYREYNEFNQLVKIWEGNNTNGTLLEEYLFHPTEDRILAKRIYKGSSNPIEYILYVNDNFVRKAWGTLNPRNDTYYIKTENGILAEVQTNGTQEVKIYYHNDHLGSNSIITNSFGEVFEKTSYGPYGEIISGGEVGRYSYESKEFSSITQDYDYDFRKYNPNWGIFIQPDAGVNNVYDPQNLNRYSFERRNPYKYIDPDGRDYIPVSEGPGVSYAGGNFEQGVVLDNLQIRNEIYKLSSAELEKELRKKYSLDSEALFMESSSSYKSRSSRGEQFRNLQVAELKAEFQIYVENDEIVKYTYRGEPTSPDTMNIHKGYSVDLIKKEVNDQYKGITGKNPPSTWESAKNTYNNIKNTINKTIESVKNIWKKIGSIFE